MKLIRIAAYTLIASTLTIASLDVLAGQASPTIPNDNNNFIGDRVIYPVDMKITIKDVRHPNIKTACLPAETPLRAIGMTSTSSLIYVLSVRSAYVSSCDPSPLKISSTAEIEVDAASENKVRFERLGITYGALAVPFKYHLKGSKSFEGGGTVAPYLGYRFDRSSFGFGIKVIGFLGLSVINVNQNINGEQKSQSLAGFSYGLGVLGQAKNEFQVGMVVGADRVSDSSNYPDNGKLWVAIAIGYSFAN